MKMNFEFLRVGVEERMGRARTRPANIVYSRNVEGRSSVIGHLVGQNLGMRWPRKPPDGQEMPSRAQEAAREAAAGQGPAPQRNIIREQAITPCF